MNTLRRFAKFAQTALIQIAFRSSNPHELPRDHRHLDDQYRRTVLAPDIAHTHLGHLLLTDAHFKSLMTAHSEHHLVRVCVVGDELRANVYELARFPCGLMVPAFNPQWRQSDVLDYYVHRQETSEDAESTFQMLPLSHPEDIDPTLTYDYYEPVRSYARPLTHAELAAVNCFTKPCWSKVA